MAKSPNSFVDLPISLSQHGLVCFGGLELTKNECATGCEVFIGRKALLIGNAGADMWHIFSKSVEYADGNPDPMNRWTKLVLDEIAQDLQCHVFYPFDVPYWPFQKLAREAAGIQSSPLGISIHPKYGLWHAFRGLFVFDHEHEYASQINALIAGVEKLNHPCDSCEEKPCLSACPVGAFTGERLDVESCFSHLDGGSNPACMSLGCQARAACPIASDRQNDIAQIQFHMKSYRGI